MPDSGFRCARMEAGCQDVGVGANWRVSMCKENVCLDERVLILQGCGSVLEKLAWQSHAAGPAFVYPLGEKIQTHTIAFELTRRKCSWMLMAQTCSFSRWEVKGKIRIQGPASLATREREVLGRKNIWERRRDVFSKASPSMLSRTIVGISGAHVPHG